MKQSDVELQEERDKIVKELELAYKRLIESKKYKKTPMVVMRNGKVTEVALNDMPSEV